MVSMALTGVSLCPANALSLYGATSIRVGITCPCNENSKRMLTLTKYEVDGNKKEKSKSTDLVFPLMNPVCLNISMYSLYSQRLCL